MKTSWGNWLIFCILSIIWGSSFILMKEGLQVFDAWQVASLRILSAGLVLLPFLAKAWKAVPAVKIRHVMLSGILGTFLPAYLFCIAETKLDSSLAGIMNALTPLFTLGIGALFFNSRIGWRKWIGVILGFLGMVMLMLVARDVDYSFIGYASFILLATLCYGINVNMVNKHLSAIGSVHIATIAFTFLIPPALMVLLYTGFFQESTFRAGWPRAISASIVLGMMGTALASVLFYVLLKKAGPIFASMVTYGIPFIAVGWGLLAGEPITLLQIACLGVILSGVYIARK